MTTAAPEELEPYTLVVLGDLMLGRLIDALLPTSIARTAPESDPEGTAKLVDEHFLPRYPHLREYGYLSPWGNSVELVKGADLVLANLETALTTSRRKWDGKVFNYRSHPENVRCLTEVGMGGASSKSYVSLANNHTLDWGTDGLVDTVEALAAAGVEFAGAGRTRDEAEEPAVLHLTGRGSHEQPWEVKCWSFSDHPADWKGVEGFNLIDYSEASRKAIKEQLTTDNTRGLGPGQEARLGLKVVSMHWGPNYRWRPAAQITELAHWLIDECDVDIIHGHSSHHVQGVELYRGRLILYGCGDFVDDYAVDQTWRNDLSAAWRVSVVDEGGGVHGRGRLRVTRLEVFPNRIQRFQACLLPPEDPDHAWLRETFTALCHEFGTEVDSALGEDGQLIISVGQ